MDKTRKGHKVLRLVLTVTWTQSERNRCDDDLNLMLKKNLFVPLYIRKYHGSKKRVAGRWTRKGG